MTTRSEYENDVFYEAWRRGIDPERATRCADDCYYDQRTPEECVDGTARQIRAERDARMMAQAEEERMLNEAEQAAYYERLEAERYAAIDSALPAPPDSAMRAEREKPK